MNTDSSLSVDMMECVMWNNESVVVYVLRTLYIGSQNNPLSGRNSAVAIHRSQLQIFLQVKFYLVFRINNNKL